MYKIHSHCRACGYGKPGAQGIKSAPTDKLIEVLDLGIQPLANDFGSDRDEHAGFAPLKVLFCPRCSLAQLSVVVRPDILYANYNYVTSTSDMMQRHFHSLWNDIHHEASGLRLLEIGSNTGDFLLFCRERGANPIMGIDPAKNLCDIAKAKDIHTLPSVFNVESAIVANNTIGKIDVVVARHVFCHIDDWRGFIAALLEVGHSETLYVIEVPYAPDTIKMNSWDQIYHEHLSYFTLQAMQALLASTGLHVHRVIKYPIHGGAIAVMLRRDESEMPPSPLTQLRVDGITEYHWHSFALHAKDQQDSLRQLLQGYADDGKIVCGFGASAKSTVWINACKLNRKHIRFICDNTPQKQWKFSPGSEIPIVDEGALLRDLPDYAVCFAWNFMPEILEKQQRYISKGGKFIVPVPEIHIVP